MDMERRLAAMTGVDEFYCELLERCAALTVDYRRICDSLPEEDRDQLEMYISICEELEYRRTCIAYILGTQDGMVRGGAQLRVD